MRRLAPALLALVLAPIPAALADEEAKPKLGPAATPIYAATEYLRSAPAPDWWTLNPFYLPQQTSSACSVAAVAMIVNGIRGLPAAAEDTLVTQPNLLEAVGDPAWASKGAEGGDGVTYAELETWLAASLAAFDLAGADIDSVQPKDAGSAELARLRAALAANEASADDLMLVYFNQGVVTGDWDGPHVSPIGAYDAATDRVLILDVDREWYVPYWTSAETLLASMLRPAPAEHGVLAGETGGYIRVTRPALH
jgi:hypothetical protein